MTKDQTFEKVKDQSEDPGELLEQFKKLDDEKVPHSEVTIKLFRSGDEEARIEILKRVDQLKEAHLRDAAYFWFATIYYETDGDLEKALSEVEKLEWEHEQTRCLVTLACMVLEKEGDVLKADSLVQRIEEDPKGYLRRYNKEKEKINN